MADGQGERHPADLPALTGLQAQITDWITIWQSELAALVTDREAQETWVRMVDLWAETAERAVRLLPARPAPADDRAAGSAGAAPPPRPAPAVAAPDARDATILRLEERVAELERRLAAPGPHAGGPDPKP